MHSFGHLVLWLSLQGAGAFSPSLPKTSQVHHVSSLSPVGSSLLRTSTTPTQLTAFMPLLEDAATLTTASTAVSSSLYMASSSGILTADNIKTAFSVATFLPQIFWLFLILLPKTDFTKKLMGGYEIITLCCIVHFFIVSASIAQPDGTAPMAEFADVFDPAGDPQKAMVGMMQYPNFVSEEWSHVLTWDLFVGRWIWLDGLKRGIFTSHSVLLCNLIGPPGLLLHWATCLVTGKGIAGNEALDIEEEKEEGIDMELR